MKKYSIIYNKEGFDEIDRYYALLFAVVHSQCKHLIELLTSFEEELMKKIDAGFSKMKVRLDTFENP